MNTPTAALTSQESVVDVAAHLSPLSSGAQGVGAQDRSVRVRSPYRTPQPDAVVAWNVLSDRHVRWVRRSLRAASRSSHKTRMGAVAASGGRLRAEAANRYRNHPSATAWVECSVHAEAALAGRHSIVGCDVYVARLLKDGQVALAKPCVGCLRVLVAAGARRVLWTIDEHHVGVMGLG